MAPELTACVAYCDAGTEPLRLRKRSQAVTDEQAARRARAVARLAARATEGDRRAFEVLWWFHRDAIARIVTARVPEVLVDDVIQEACLKAMEGMPRLADPERFSGWFCTIARNVARDALLRNIRDNPREASREEDPLDRAAPPHAVAEAEEILLAVDGLPKAYRESLRLRLESGLSGPEIAALTGHTLGAIRVNLCRGFKILRRRVGDHE